MPTLEKILSRSKSNTTKKQKEKKDKNTSKKKEILYKDNTSGITYYSDGSTSKIKKEAPKKEGNWWEGRRAKKDRAATKKGMAESKMKSTIAKAEKKYAAESMFKSTKAKDEQKTKAAKPRPFGVAFRSAKDAGKKTFLWKGKQYYTKTKDELEAKYEKGEHYPTTSDTSKAKPKKKSIVGKLNEKIRSFRKKTTGYATQSEYEDAKAKRRIEKRISKMKERKNQGKNYSAKNLAELQEKIKGM